ncbi:MAG: TolC family protein [Sedimentisphaerales bacterium]|nr:TolC family protein [Sedimentisphaerales bacterium]
MSKPWMWIGFCASLGLLAAGCSTEQYKAQADREVYRIIEDKWQDDFGSKANYRISDVEPDRIDVQAVAPSEVSGRLTLAEAVALATAHNRSYQSQKESLYLSALDLSLSRHEFAPQFSGLFGGDYTRSAADESVSANGQLGFNQLLADGARVSTQIATDWLRFLTGDPRTSLGSVLSATVSQPLLRGAGRKIVQENLTQAERNTLYQIRSFNRYRKEFVVQIVSQYFNVLETLDRVKNEKSNYDRLVLAHNQTKMLAESGRRPPLEADQAEQDKLSAWDSYIAAQESYKQQLDSFKITLGIPTEAAIELDPNELDRLGGTEINEPEYEEQLLIDSALTHRLDLMNARDQVEDAERRLAVAADNLGMELNLIGSANVSSPDGQRPARLQFQQGTYSIGLEGDLNLDRKAERNAYREALITLTQRRRSYTEEKDQVIFDVRQTYRDLREAAARYEIQQMSLRLAQQRVDSTAMLLQAGRAITRDLLESQRSLLQAQNSRTSALVRYTIANLEFYRDLGVLQVRPDGLWEQGTP